MKIFITASLWLLSFATAQSSLALSGTEIISNLKKILPQKETQGYIKLAYESDEQALQSAELVCTLSWIKDPATGFRGIQLYIPLSQVGARGSYLDQFIIDPQGEYKLSYYDDYQENPQHIYQRYSYTGTNHEEFVFNEILFRPQSRIFRVFLRKIRDVNSGHFRGDGTECIFRY